MLSKIDHLLRIDVFSSCLSDNYNMDLGELTKESYKVV